MRNSFPPRAVPSTWGPEEELSEGSGETERVPKMTIASATWARGIPRYQVAGSVSERACAWGGGCPHTIRMCAYIQSCLTLCDPIDCSPPGSSVHWVLRQEYWSGLPFPTLGDPSNRGIKATSLLSPALTGGFFTTSTTWEALSTHRPNYKRASGHSRSQVLQLIPILLFHKGKTIPDNLKHSIQISEPVFFD